jgi:hypothetical protein
VMAQAHEEARRADEARLRAGEAESRVASLERKLAQEREERRTETNRADRQEEAKLDAEAQIQDLLEHKAIMSRTVMDAEVQIAALLKRQAKQERKGGDVDSDYSPNLQAGLPPEVGTPVLNLSSTYT